jgi:hypothetical protein
MDFNIPLLEEVITTNRLDFPTANIQDLIEIVRMLDILGTEERYKEYGLVLYEMLNRVPIIEWSQVADRIPVSYENLANKFYFEAIQFEDFIAVFSENIYILGSNSLLTYRSNCFPGFDKEKAFWRLCHYGHLEFALNQFDESHQIRKDFQSEHYQLLFQTACKYGQFQLAQEIYNTSNAIINIHENQDLIFRLACESGHLQLSQWIYSNFGEINIHAFENEVFALTCVYGHFHIIKWLIALDTLESFRMTGTTLFYFGKSLSHNMIENWFYESNFISYFELNLLFQDLCYYGNFASVQRLFSHFQQ